MDDVSRQGQTVLFVSHQMPLMARLCKRGILLEKGSVVVDGSMDEVIHRYRADLSELSKVSVAERTDRDGSGDVMVTGIEVVGDRHRGSTQPMSGEPFSVRLHYRCKPDGPHAACRVSLLFRHEGELLFIWSTALAQREELQLQDSGYIDFETEELPLPGGTYTIGVFVESDGKPSDVIRSVAEFIIVDGDFFGTGIVKPSGYLKNSGTLVKHTCRIHRD
jgi:lipopolysaccharide transport system ATP-binding protein